MKKRIYSLVGIALGLCLLCTACSQKEAKAEEKPIQIALTQDILSFDPMLTSDIFSEAVLRCVYTSLYDWDEDLNLRPKLAKNSTVVDEHTWLIEIHQGVSFQDGTPLTVDDVIFSIERAMAGGRTEKLLEMVESLEKNDEYSFYLRAKEPYPNLLTLFAKAETSIVSKAVVEKEGYDFSQPVGAGPYRLLSRVENEKIALERFEDYYLEKAKSPYLNFLVIVTEQERTAAFLNGDVEILFSVSAYDCDKLKVSKGVKLLEKPSTKIEYLSLNTHRPPLNDPKVRRAISYAIDRDNITRSIYHGYSKASASLIPEGVIGFVEPEISYDPEQAKALLREAGYEEGFSFTVIAIDTIRKNTLEYIKLDLAKVGINLQYKLVTMKEAVDLMTAGEHDGILVGWAFNQDPNGVLPLVLGSGSGKTMNSSNYSNPELDRLIQAGRKEADLTKQQEIYEAANRLVVADSPIVILQNPKVLCATRDNIEGIYLNPQGLIQYESLYRN